jgi:excisionase family DNA binding protein
MFSSFARGSFAAFRQQEAPTSAGTPAGAHIETLGATMQVEGTRLYRVRAVAEALDVSLATIYRAVETGALRAIRLGTGKGAVRIPGEAVEDYLAACQSAAATRTSRSDEISIREGSAAGGAA